MPEQDASYSLASVGLGTRLQVLDWLSGSLDWAYAPAAERTRLPHSSRSLDHATLIDAPTDRAGRRIAVRRPSLVAARLAVPQANHRRQHRAGHAAGRLGRPHAAAGAPAHRQLHL
ncbi:hypothetical protein G6F23_013719 [Rhizopus arrhizus]|nr:hypothetical protein G6F23_013719 [Rhizopus arrhizus]